MLGRKVVYDAHEDLPNQVLNKPYLSKNSARIAKFISHLLLQITRVANLSVAATETIAENLPNVNIAVVHNYPPLRVEEVLAAHRGINERESRIVYVGGVSTARGCRVMIDTMGSNGLPEGWRMTLAGQIDLKDLVVLKKLGGWERVDYHGQVGPEIARELILGSKLGLVLLADTPAYRASLPTKMFEYFAAGVPVIASDFPLWQKLVQDNGCGILVNPQSPEEVVSAIRRYTENPQLLEEHSKNARNLAVTKFNWKTEGEILTRAYEQIA
jgi:glycosyltransferase involved in cell wall biosynthesis